MATPTKNRKGSSNRGRPRTTRKPLTPNSASYHINIDKQAAALTEETLVPFLEELVEIVIKEVTAARISRPHRKLPINLSLERNKLNDAAVDMIVECLSQLSDYIDVHIVRLHMNCIKDEGMKSLAKLVRLFPVTELHLSHNYVTWVGFQYIYKEVLRPESHYPLLPRESPLWLRLECNQIDIPKIELFLQKKSNQNLVCTVKARGNRKGECNNKYCSKKTKFSVTPNGKAATAVSCKLHVPYLTFQKQSLTALCTVRSLSSKSSKKKKANGKSIAASPVHQPDLDGPLLILLDTCTIIDMSKSKDFFTFEWLIKQRRKNLFDDQIHFILIDTVFQQLDARKKETRNAKERIAVRHFVDDLLPEATKLGLLHYVHPMELEDEVRARGGHISAPNFRKQNGKFDSDGLILDCAHFLMEQYPNRVLVLTDDIPCKARALMNHLPAETRRELIKKLPNGNTEQISRSLLLQACTDKSIHVFEQNKKLENAGGSTPKPRGSLIAELSTAREIVQKLSILLREALGDDTSPLCKVAEDCFVEAQESLDSWSRLIENHQQLKKLAIQKHTTSVRDSPSLFDSPNRDFTDTLTQFRGSSSPARVVGPILLDLDDDHGDNNVNHEDGLHEVDHSEEEDNSALFCLPESANAQSAFLETSSFVPNQQQEDKDVLEALSKLNIHEDSKETFEAIFPAEIPSEEIFVEEIKPEHILIKEVVEGSLSVEEMEITKEITEEMEEISAEEIPLAEEVLTEVGVEEKLVGETLEDA